MPTAVWAPKPDNWRPIPQRTAVDHAGRSQAGASWRADWRELLVDDGRLMAEYVSAPPGTPSAARFHPDTREWFAVVEGEVRVEIEGQAPFTATRGSLVNIPRQTLYTVETVGTSPSLRFVVNVRTRRRCSPRDAAPPTPPDGMDGCRPRSTARRAATTSSTSRT